VIEASHLAAFHDHTLNTSRDYYRQVPRTTQKHVMAELVLGIAGVALAWKGILDFGKLISKLTDNDTRQRDILAIKLESSQHALKDWGDYWGVERNNGRFHSFETSRKELIMKIIFRLRDSRSSALKRLKDRYGISTGEDDEDDMERDSGKRLSKMVDRVVAAAKKGKEKSLWLLNDRVLVTELVEETMELYTVLQTLTSMSTKVLCANLTAYHDVQSLQSGLTNLEHKSKEEVQGQRYNAQRESFDDGLDHQTLASFASKSITSSEQAERVQRYIDQSFHYHGDARVPEIIGPWWNDAQADIMILEVPDNAEDRTSTSALVLLYYLVDCHKLIFVLDSETDKRPLQQFHDMLRTLIQSLVSLRGNKPLHGITLPLSITDMENAAVDTTTMQQLVVVFHELLHDVLTDCDRRVLLIIDGLELLNLDTDDSLGHLLSSFVSGLRKICNMPSYQSKAVLKALLGYKGHATTLYDCVGVTDVVNLTDRATRETCMMEDLVQAIHDR
jgi:hypothetical protein